MGRLEPTNLGTWPTGQATARPSLGETTGVNPQKTETFVTWIGHFLDEPWFQENMLNASNCATKTVMCHSCHVTKSCLLQSGGCQKVYILTSELVTGQLLKNSVGQAANQWHTPLESRPHKARHPQSTKPGYLLSSWRITNPNGCTIRHASHSWRSLQILKMYGTSQTMTGPISLLLATGSLLNFSYELVMKHVFVLAMQRGSWIQAAKFTLEMHWLSGDCRVDISFQNRTKHTTWSVQPGTKQLAAFISCVSQTHGYHPII